MKDRIIVALDTDSPESALATVKALSGEVGMFKVGMELFPRGGPELVRRIREAGFDVFLDLKFHDIPNTVSGAVRSAAALGVKFATVHASGGRAMLTAAAETARGTGTTILAVTVLTSLDDADLADVGFSLGPAEAVARLADLAVSCGIKGIVCSAKEVEAVRARVGKG
ncbi:MAG TPA: orotidine-5'-phosphate decarboxylase, partial [Candidatus Deferrimicrobium sp.]